MQIEQFVCSYDDYFFWLFLSNQVLQLPNKSNTGLPNHNLVQSLNDQTGIYV